MFHLESLFTFAPLNISRARLGVCYVWRSLVSMKQASKKCSGFSESISGCETRPQGAVRSLKLGNVLIGCTADFQSSSAIESAVQKNVRLYNASGDHKTPPRVVGDCSRAKDAQKRAKWSDNSGRRSAVVKTRTRTRVQKRRTGTKTNRNTDAREKTSIA